MNDVNGRIPRGDYKRMHDEALEKVDLVSVGFTLNYGTIKARVGRKTTKSRPGPKSPSLAIGPYLLTFVLYRQEAGQPMSKSEVVKLANEMTKGSVIEGDVVRFHSKSKTQPEILMGPTWYSLFMKRKHCILNSRWKPVIS